jgi:hypothetical protein
MESKINQEIPIEDKLNKSEINELKKISIEEKYFTKKYYTLFINHNIFIPTSANDYYCLGYYHHFIVRNYFF